jgi:hypothetical protein
MATPQAAHDAKKRADDHRFPQPRIPWSCSITRGTPGSINGIGNHAKKRLVRDRLLSRANIPSTTCVVGSTFEPISGLVCAAVTVEY